MGLDVNVFSRLEVLEPLELGGDTTVAITEDDIEGTEEWWPGRTAGLPRTSLKPAPGSTEWSFRAGSYSSYGSWRDELSKLAHGIPAAEFWRQERKEGAFAELINFSDCDGVIGPIVAKKLAQDFADYQDQANDFGNAWFAESFDRFRKAFELASSSGAGAVRFC